MKARPTLLLDLDRVLHPDELDTFDDEFGLKIAPRHFAHIPILAEAVGDTRDCYLQRLGAHDEQTSSCGAFLDP